MRLVFMGTPDFAEKILEALLAAGHEVACVVTQADKPVGRKAILTAPPVKELALSRGIPVLQPSRMKDPDFLKELAVCGAEAFIVAAFGRILPKEILELPPKGCLNVHASLLPKYRGAAPIQWAILDGEEKTGVTIMQMDEGLDTGDMLAKAEVPIGPEETGGSLFDKLAKTGGELLCEVLDRAEKEALTGEAQPEESPTAYARMIKKEDGRVDWSRPAEEIERKIRGLDPWPSAWTILEGRQLKIWKAEVAGEEDREGEAGSVLLSDDGKWIVKTGDGALRLLEIQWEGKKRMGAAEFLRGHRIGPGSRLGE